VLTPSAVLKSIKYVIVGGSGGTVTIEPRYTGYVHDVHLSLIHTNGSVSTVSSTFRYR